MTARALLGKSLKSDEVIDLLEEYDVDVVYSFDRIHENRPDAYWASIGAAGIQLGFDEEQRLVTAFCYLMSRNGFSPVLPEAIGVPVFDSFAVAEQTCRDHGLKYEASAPPGLWLKVLGASLDSHYEYEDGRISMITLMLRRDGA